MAQVSTSRPSSVAIGQPAGWRGASGTSLVLQNGLWILITLVLAVLVLLPLFYILIESLRTPAGLSLANYTQILSLGRFHQAMLNSLILGLACAILGMLLGAPLA